MKVWLDDQKPAPKGWRRARNYREALRLLKTGKVTFISLDHDIGRGKSGYDVATWIEDQANAGTLKQLDWEVHSENPPGRYQIAQAMRSAERYWVQ
jgi:hypothetical protein